MNLSILFVTHDVSVLAKICDRIYIMYAGKVVETGKTRDLLKNPLHPYTIGLKRSFPNLYHYADRLVSIPGSPPNLLSPPSGCRFYERCPMGEHKCVDEEPEIARYAEGRYVACHYTDRITDQFREKAFLKERIK
jgi:peptide/nickel transport system ATP-binding protein